MNQSMNQSQNLKIQMDELLNLQLSQENDHNSIFYEEEFSASNVEEEYNKICQSQHFSDEQFSQLSQIEEQCFLENENQSDQQIDSKNINSSDKNSTRPNQINIDEDQSSDTDEFQRDLTNDKIIEKWKQWIQAVQGLPEPRKTPNQFLVRKKRQFRSNKLEKLQMSSHINPHKHLFDFARSQLSSYHLSTDGNTKLFEEKKKYQKIIEYPQKSQFLDQQLTVKEQNGVETKKQPGKRKRRKITYKSMTLRELKELQKMFNSKKYTVVQISEYFNMSTNTVYRYLKKFQEADGNLVKHCLTSPGKGNHKKKPIKQKHIKTKAAILEVIRKNPKIYQSQIAIQLKHRHNLNVSQSTVSRLMKTINLVKKKPQKIFIDTNTGSNIQKRFLYCQLYRSLDKDKLIFVDESHFNNRINRQKGWVIKGENFHCQEPADGSNKFSVLMAISYEKMLEYTIKFGHLNSEDMVQFIEEQIQNKYPGYTMILDNHRIHKTPQVKQALDKYNIKHIYLPPYTPLLNPIQNVFHQLKMTIRTLRALNQDQALQKIIQRGIDQISTRNFEKYKQFVEKWVEKGLKKEKFVKSQDKSETSSVNNSTF